MVVAHIELAKVDVLQHAGEGGLALLQYLLKVEIPFGDFKFSAMPKTADG